MGVFDHNWQLQMLFVCGAERRPPKLVSAIPRRTPSDLNFNRIWILPIDLFRHNLILWAL